MDINKKSLNKKGATYGAWIEVLVMIILFVGALAIIGGQMNNLYNQNKDLTYGLQTNETQTALNNLQGNFVNSTSEGQSSMTDFGIFKLTTLPFLVLSTTSLLWNFISGNFINILVGMMGLGEFTGIVIILIKILYYLAISFILIKLILKVIP